jgi:hypothetical protein
MYCKLRDHGRTIATVAAAWVKGGGRYCRVGVRRASIIRSSQAEPSCLFLTRNNLEAPVTDHGGGDAIPVPVFQGVQSRVRTAYSIFIKGVLVLA